MQSIIHRYYGLDTSRLHNQRFVETVRAGVYSGFKLRVNAGYQDRIDIVRGDASRSVLVTSEGVIIEETEDLPNAVRVQPADSVRTRIDLVVCEYRYTPDVAVEAVYKVLRGRNQADLSVDPVPPAPENEYQVPLGTVTVLPQLASGGSAQVRVDQADIVQAAEADFILPEDLGALKPEIDFTNPKRIFVYPGVFPNALKDAVIRWPGGYSEEIDDATMTEGETRYFLFAISDDRQVTPVAWSSDPDTLSGYDAEVLPLCVAKATKSGGVGRILSLEDVRFPFARQLTPQFELTSYQTLLATSVFRYVRVDLFENSDLIDLTPVSGPTGYETLLRVFIDRSDSSLTFEWTGTTLPDDDVIVVTENLLENLPVSVITHFQVSFDTNIPSLTFEYSSVSKYSGFTDQRFLADKIVGIPSGGAGRLYIRFRIPKDAFQVMTTLKLYSYGVLLDLDPETVNRRVIVDLGMENLLAAVPNLIVNGNFRFWSRNDKDDVEPDSDSPARIDYAAASDASAIEAGDRVFAADGWQFTKLQYEGTTEQVSRVLFSQEARSADIENALDTCLLWEGKGGAPGPVNHLEFRVPVRPEMLGQRVTFALDFEASSRDALGIGLAFYSRDENGAYTLVDRAEAGATTTSGTLLLQSALAVSEATYAIGAIVILRQTTGDSRAFVKAARMAMGSFLRLAYSSTPYDRDRLRAYYERGRSIAAFRGVEGDAIYATAQFGRAKDAGLSKDGALVANLIASGNRSVGVDSIVLTPTTHGLVVSGRVISSGLATLDVEWEAYPLYPATE